MDINGDNVDKKNLTRIIISTVFLFIVPFLFIWSVNTLFGTGILLTFKTWAAAFVLVLLIRFIFRSSPAEHRDYDDYDDYDYEDQELEEIFRSYSSEGPEQRRQRMKDNIITYKDLRKKKSPPPEKT